MMPVTESGFHAVLLTVYRLHRETLNALSFNNANPPTVTGIMGWALNIKNATHRVIGIPHALRDLPTGREFVRP